MERGEKTVSYIGYYALPEDGGARRLSFPSAVRKMDYICGALNEAGYRVKLISPSWAQAEAGYFPGGQIDLGGDKTLVFFPSFGAKSRVLKKIRAYWSFVLLTLWLLAHVKRGEPVLVYHSLLTIGPLLFARRIRGFQIILEVEEIYSDVSQQAPDKSKNEEKMFQAAGAFLFSTALLAKRIAPGSRQYLTVNGEYRMQRQAAAPRTDGKIHLVYAGLIDTAITAGAFIALESARYLSNQYALHILGYGSGGDIALLHEKIAEINGLGGCGVSYEGLKTGAEYISFMQGCHIALSTRRTDARYLQTSFPSKILSYLSFGLRVVSCDIESVRFSRFGSLIRFYSGDTPQGVAQAIENVDICGAFDPGPLLTAAHNEFVAGLGGLFQ